MIQFKIWVDSKVQCCHLTIETLSTIALIQNLRVCLTGVDFLGRPVVVFVGRHFQARNVDLNKVCFDIFKNKLFFLFRNQCV